MYGYEIQKLLAAHGDKIQLSHLYKILKEMCGEDLLESQLREGEAQCPFGGARV